MSSATPAVTIHEVGPRDGLQNETQVLPLAVKLELVERLVAAGLRSLEVASFVSPQWIPQLADSDELAGRLPAFPGVHYRGLVPNLQGYERFRRAGGIERAAVFISASETHNRKNVNRSVAEHLARLAPVLEQARADGVPIRAYVSTAFGCPDEGPVAVEAVVRLTRDLVAMGAEDISLGDTIGVGVPGQVRELVDAVGAVVPLSHVALHFHDTYGRGIVNVQAGYEAGVRDFDASLGGLGGCPYAPGAAGNVATEDVVDLFERSGISTGIDLQRLVETTRWLEEDVLKRPLTSRVYRAERGVRERARRRDGAPSGEQPQAPSTTPSTRGKQQ
jgi:hydroxymethylglutaryl-CoA lyase